MSQPVAPGLTVGGGIGGGVGPPGPPGVTARQALGPVRFIDPANSTGFAADTNTGATANNVPPGSGPILTTARLNALLFFTFLQGNVTITYLSDDASGTLLDPSTVFVATGQALNFQGTPQVTHTGATLNAGTVAINPIAASGGQSQTVHTSDVADFTPFVFAGLPFVPGTSAHPQYVLDTTGANNGTSAWIATIGGGIAPTTVGTPDVSRPVTAGSAAGALTSGDSYKIQRGSLLAVAGKATTIGATGLVFGGSTNISFNDFAFTTGHIGLGGCQYFRCSLDGPLLVGGIFTHCFLGGDITELGLPMASVDINAGVLITIGGIGECVAPLNLSGDTYCTGSGLDLGPQAYNSIFISPGIGAGIQLTRFNSSAIHCRGNNEMGSDAIGTALIWGKNNGGQGIVIGNSCSLSVSSSKPPTVTGASDFSFLGPSGAGSSVARAFDPTTGEYTEIGGVATRTCTWAHFAASIAAGGFNFQAHLPEANGHLIGG